MPSLPSGARLAEIGQQPARAGSGSGGQSGHDFGEGVFRETIEHEMSHDEIVSAGRQVRGADIFENEANVRRGDPHPGEGDHACAGVEAIDRGVRISPNELSKKTPVPLAHDEHPPRGVDLPHEREARPLQLITENQRLEPAIC